MGWLIGLLAVLARQFAQLIGERRIRQTALEALRYLCGERARRQEDQKSAKSGESRKAASHNSEYRRGLS